MLLDYSHGTLDSPENLEGTIKTGEDLKIIRFSEETDEAYAEKVIKIVRASGEVLKIFDDGSWDSGSVIDAISLGLAGVVVSNYRDQEVDPLITTILAERIRAIRKITNGQTPEKELTDDDILELVNKFQLVDRPIGGEKTEKLRYARRVFKALGSLEDFVALANVSEFDIIEALCIELAKLLGKSPLPVEVIKPLVERISVNAESIKEDLDNNEDT